MKTWLICLFAVCLCVGVAAQPPLIYADGSVVVRRANDTLKFTPFGRNIIKVSARLHGYNTNEMVSDAVAIQPYKSAVKVRSYNLRDHYVLWDGFRIELKGDTIFFGEQNKAALLGLFDSANYKGFNFLLAENEKIFGGGERALPLNRRGYRFNLYNNPWYGYGMGADNLNYSVPFFTSSKQYALLFDNPSKAFIDIGKNAPGILRYAASSGELNFYIIIGDSYPHILSSYHKLTGTQPLPPRWSMGNFLSRFGYVSEADIKEVMQKSTAAQVPYDAVIFDLFWFGDSIKGTMGNLDWVNKKAWPNPAKMIGDFLKQGTKTILITEPFVLQSSSNYTASQKFHAVDSFGKPYVLKNFYFGNGGLIDIFRKDSKDWFWSKYKMQMIKGVEGWWGDLGEPEKHPADLYHNLKDLGQKRLFAADEIHNMYGHYWTKMLYEKYAKDYPAKRLFSLNRSGFAGTQRYSIFPWSGDVSRSWNGLHAQLPVMLGMSMSGVPYIHADAGGFAGGEKDGELYVRWLQFAAYTPIFRPHGTELSKVDTLPVSFPSEAALMAEPYKTLAKHVADLRYSLLPYNYSLAYQQAVYGKPLVSPLYFYFTADSVSYQVEDEYMWGEHLLIAPVLAKGVSDRRIYLPSTTWYNVANNKKYESGWYTEPVNMQAIPVFAKAGSFVPRLTRRINNTTAYNTSNLMLTYYPSPDPSTYTLYDDDGQTKNAIEQKLFERIEFESEGFDTSGTITIATNKGKFTGKPVNRLIHLHIPGLGRQPAGITINNTAITAKPNNDGMYVAWDADKEMLTVHIVLKQDNLSIKFTW